MRKTLFLDMQFTLAFFFKICSYYNNLLRPLFVGIKEQLKVI